MYAKEVDFGIDFLPFESPGHAGVEGLLHISHGALQLCNNHQASIKTSESSLARPRPRSRQPLKSSRVS